MNERPDILVLGGGGRQGDAWMTGMLAGLEDAHGIAFAGCDHYVGTSAGAIVAAKLATGRSLRRPELKAVGAASGEPSPWPNWAVNSAMAMAAPFAGVGLRLATRPAELVRGTALGALTREAAAAPDFRQAFAERRVRFDGRLRIVAVERESGRRVVFGGPGAPHATVAQALTASCALPLVFAPAVIDGREYVDGAVWSPTNADVAPASRDAHVLILATMASRYGPWNAALRAATGALLLAEASALKARGAHVRIITPDRGSAASIGTDLMSDERLAETGAAGYAQGLRA
ncbi:MAG TPA: patatin-like phospholipase family protein [Solirubrobacteraceae bacterium]|nr:patatin-like phospholipase family protein [Solirubrobacteraceae bacterium]